MKKFDRIHPIERKIRGKIQRSFRYANKNTYTPRKFQ